MAFDPAHPMDAVILYHEETADDNKSHAYFYIRMKILTDKGKDRASVEIPYDGASVHIIDIKARTIAPDGTITPFSGKAFDSTIVKGRGVKYLAKTFSLPNVQVGSIIEWKYTRYWDDSVVYAPHWTVQSDLPQKRAKFTFIPLIKTNHWVENARGQVLDQVYYSLVGLPEGTAVKTVADSRMELELKDVPAFEREDFSPPEAVLKMRVNFYYGTSKMGKPAEFWKEEGKYWSKDVEKSVGHVSGAAAAGQAASPSDTTEQKVRKIYDRLQKIKNLTFASEEGSLEEIAGLRGKEKRTLDDVLRTNEGYRDELVHLFVALVRAAGIPAYAMRVADRDEVFFQINVPNRDQLTSEIAIVAIDGKEVFLDPGTPLCPYGLLAWQHTATYGIRQLPDGGTELTQTPSPVYKDAVSKRVGRLALAEDGSLRGKIALAWNGEEALTRRLSGLKTDEAGRKKELEDELRAILPRGSTVQLDSLSGWEDQDKQITAWFKVEVPSFATATGKRMLVPTALFEANSRQPFAQGERKQLVYFIFPFYTLDDVQISLPSGFAIESLPQTQPIRTDFSFYQFKRSASGNQLLFTRDFAMGAFAFRPQDYAELKKLYSGVKIGDSEQVVLTAAAK